MPDASRPRASTGSGWRPPDGQPRRSLAYLLLAATATSRVELGTCIYIVPRGGPTTSRSASCRSPRLAARRFSLGVGTGSSALEYERAGLDFADRFTLIRDTMATIRSICSGEVNDYQREVPAGLEQRWSEESARRASSSALAQPASDRDRRTRLRRMDVLVRRWVARRRRPRS